MTNAIAQIFDTPSALPRLLGQAVEGIDPLGGAILRGTASATHDIASNPLVSTLATGVAGYFGGPWAAAGASAALSRERGDSIEKSLTNGAIAGALSYGATQLGGGGTNGGVDVGGGVDQYGNVLGGGNYAGGGADVTDYGVPSENVTPPADSVPDPSIDPRADDVPATTKPTEGAPEAPKTPDAKAPEKSGTWDTVKKTATQVGTTAAISTILTPKKPDQPTPAIKPITPMPDPLAQEAARRRALVEQIMRRGRTSTIMTDTGS